MPEVFETDNLQSVASRPIIQVIDDLVAALKIDQVEIKLVRDGVDEANQVLVLLCGTIKIALFVNQPGDLGVRPKASAKLFGAQAGCMHEIRPPMIVRIGFVLFPLMQRRSAHHHDPFPGRMGGRHRSNRHDRQCKNKQRAFHRVKESTIYAGDEIAQVRQATKMSTL